MTDSVRPVLMAWSGGKDSCMALHRLMSDPGWRVTGLLTTVTEQYRRVSMHGVPVELLRAQADSIGLPLEIVYIPPDADNEIYQHRMGETLERCRSAGVHTVAFGDLFLEDVRDYRIEMLARVAMDAVFPVWGIPTDELARAFIDAGHRAILTCVDTDQLDGAFSGRLYDDSLLAELPDGVDPCGENGEFHSFVFAGPLLTEVVGFEAGDKVMRENRFLFCDLKSQP